MLNSILWWGKIIVVCAILMFVLGVIHGSRKH